MAFDTVGPGGPSSATTLRQTGQSGPTGRTEARESSDMDTVRAIGDELQASQNALLWMLIEDAKNGSVKDPKGRNITGRKDKKTARQDKRLIAEKGEGAEAMFNASAQAPSEGTDSGGTSQAALGRADGALRKLAAATKSNAFGPEKIVDLRELV